MKPAEFYQRDRLWQPPALEPDYKTSVARSPRPAMLSLRESLSEITGPVFGHDDIDLIDNTIPDPRAIDQLIAPLDMNAAIPLDCLAYKFDVVLRGSRSTLFENRLEGN